MEIKRIISALLVFAAISCNHKSTEYKKVFSDPLLYSRTVKRLNDVVLENNFPPMIASRNYAYANIAAYETMAAANDSFQSLSGQINICPTCQNHQQEKK